MKIDNLQNGQIVRLRKGRAGEHGVIWGEWQDLPLYIQRNNKGEVVIVAVEGWAEYNPKYDLDGEGVFIAEDYYMEIKS